MVRPTDQETTAIEKIEYYTHRSKEKGGHTMSRLGARQGTGGATRVGQRQREQGKCGQKPLLGFLWKETGEPR